MSAAVMFVTALALATPQAPEPDATAGAYDVDRYIIAGGTATASGGAYRVDGTVGQADVDALQPASAGAYDVVGGFWPGAGGGTGDRIFANGFQ